MDRERSLSNRGHFDRIEVDWDGNILWEWTASDHIDEFGLDKVARDAIYNRQMIPGQGAEPIGEEDFPADEWLHCNSVSYLGPNKWYEMGDERFHPENIIFDSRHANFMAIIDKSTGELVWKVGPDYSEGNPESSIGQLVGMHNAHMIPRGLPGEGNILVFDNGGFAGYGELLFGFTGLRSEIRNYSRVVEFNPVSLEVVWEYKKRVPRRGGRYRFFSYYASSAQRLENGNTLITEGATGRVFELTRDKEIVW